MTAVTWAARKRVPWPVRLRIMKSIDFTCAYCGGRSTARNDARSNVGPDGHPWQVDHIRPARRDDLTTLEEGNLTLACATCNALKGSLPLDGLPAELQRMQAHIEAMLANQHRWPR